MVVQRLPFATEVTTGFLDVVTVATVIVFQLPRDMVSKGKMHAKNMRKHFPNAQVKQSNSWHHRQTNLHSHSPREMQASCGPRAEPTKRAIQFVP